MRGRLEVDYRNWIFVHSVMTLSSLAPRYLITRKTFAFLLSLLSLISRRTSSLTRLHSFPYLALTDGSFPSPHISRKVQKRAIKARGYPGEVKKRDRDAHRLSVIQVRGVPHFPNCRAGCLFFFLFFFSFFFSHWHSLAITGTAGWDKARK